MRPDRTELAHYIRFQLSNLRARNEHHTFEHLCRELVRLRIVSNILPATGPVAARGDQGRDFETFRSLLERQDPPTSAFQSRLQERDIAFTCTLQMDKIEPKIRADVTAMHASNYRPEVVYTFTELNIPVGIRHQTERTIGEEFSCEVHIWDGEAIADHLADGDTVWIAERYLGVPASFIPRLEPAVVGWYEAVRERWRDPSATAVNFGDLSEIREAARHATWEPGLTSDLPLWIDALGRVVKSSNSAGLRRTAYYERFVASLRGLRTLDGVEDDVAAYLEEATSLRNVHHLRDAQVLLTYVRAAQLDGVTTIETGQLHTWRKSLGHRCEELLADPSISLGETCALMEMLAILAIPFSDPPILPTAADLEEPFSWWRKLLVAVDQAPLFPVGHIGQYFAELAVILSVHPSYREVTNRLDQLIGERAGRSAAAALCRDRAIAFRRAGRLSSLPQVLSVTRR